MDAKAVESALESALRAIAEPPPAARRGPPGEGEKVIDVRRALELAAPVVEALERQAEFRDGSGYLIFNGDGETGFHAAHAALALVRRARGGGSPRVAVAWLERVLRMERAEGYFVSALWGISVSRRIDLAEGLALLPAVDLPDSATRRWLFGSARKIQDAPLAPVAFGQVPAAALVKDVVASPLWRRPDDPQWGSSGPSLAEHVDDVLRALTCLGPSAPVVAAEWFEFKNPDLQPLARGGGITKRFRDSIMSIQVATVDLTELDPGAVVRQFLAARPPLRDRLRVSLDRLSRAVRHFQPGEKAIDLSIALESLLVDGGGENTFKVALRAGLLAAPPLERRRRTRAIAEALYRIRSAMVHSGAAPDETSLRGFGKLPTSKVVDEGLGAVAGLLRAVIARGSLPDWSVLELGGDLGGGTA